MARTRSGQQQQLLLSVAAAALLCAACAFSLSVADVGESKVFFFEPFDEHYESRWTVSKDPAYEGKWVHEKAEGLEDYGLVVSEKARKYAIAAALPQPAELMKELLVLQYEVRAQKGMDCGGAYLKFLMPQEAGWAPEDFKDSSPYSIMFGPDKCGATNKVHFIFRHKSPKTGEFVEHHLASPPVPRTEWVTHVYTAVVYPNNTVRVLVNGEEKASADMLSYKDFAPPVLLPKTIPDPDDKKPEDWDERPKIADPDAKKPDDWDENAPREILDEDAKKPEGWLDDEPLEVDDPEASKPEDWDDDEDGEWEPPKVPNPKCDEAPGCGEWKRPMKKNPAYKGKWSAPLIDNPAYKGIWKPRDIPNPEYFDLEKPALESIAAVGIEIWTMNDGVLFDNILITNDETLAEEYRNTKWKPKYDREKEIQKEKQKKEEEEKKKNAPKASDKFKDKVFDLLYRIADAPVLKNYKKEITDLIERGEDRPEVVYSLIMLFFFSVVLIIYSILPGKKKRRARARVTVEQAKKEDISGADDSAPAAPAAAEAAAEPAAEPAAAEEPSAAASAAEPSAPVAAAVEDKAEEEDESGGAKVRRRTRRDT